MTIFHCFLGRSHKTGLTVYKVNYPPANEVAKGYSNATVRPSFRNIHVNTLESTSFNGFWPDLVHTQSLRESRTLLIFKVKGQGHQVKFLGEGIHHALRCPCYTRIQVTSLLCPHLFCYSRTMIVYQTDHAP